MLFSLACPIEGWRLPLAILATLLSIILAYLLGSLPFGVWICRLGGRDPRSVGSGRTGGTNVYRTSGLVSALATVALDMAKGFVAVEAARRLAAAAGAGAEWAVPLAALAAILGHNHSLFAGFRGGAGSTPNVGALVAIDPIVAAVGLAVAGVCMVGIRIASVVSMALSAVILIGLGWRVVDGVAPPQMLAYALGQAALVLWALRPNIERLRQGRELRVRMPWEHRPPAAQTS
jgi:glycerol-3-phosphate acyltransferase PlsY